MEVKLLCITIFLVHRHYLNLFETIIVFIHDYKIKKDDRIISIF